MAGERSRIRRRDSEEGRQWICNELTRNLLEDINNSWHHRMLKEVTGFDVDGRLDESQDDCLGDEFMDDDPSNFYGQLRRKRNSTFYYYNTQIGN